MGDRVAASGRRGPRPTDGAAVMTPGVPGGDGGYADTPTAPTVPLAWGSPGGPGQRAPTQPLPGIASVPALPRPRPAPRRIPRPPDTRATAPWPSRLPRWLRRALITVLTVALAAVLAFVALLLLTPSVST